MDGDDASLGNDYRHHAYHAFSVLFTFIMTPSRGFASIAISWKAKSPSFKSKSVHGARGVSAGFKSAISKSNQRIRHSSIPRNSSTASSRPIHALAPREKARNALGSGGGYGDSSGSQRAGSK